MYYNQFTWSLKFHSVQTSRKKLFSSLRHYYESQFMEQIGKLRNKIVNRFTLYAQRRNFGVIYAAMSVCFYRPCN